MRIKKKSSKPSSKRPPLYFIGYRGTPPKPDELKTWYDLEYGGPLIVRSEEDAPESWHATHGPWTAHIVIPLPATHTAGFKEQLAWEHDLMGAVAPSIMPPRDMPDTILFDGINEVLLLLIAAAIDAGLDSLPVRIPPTAATAS